MVLAQFLDVRASIVEPGRGSGMGRAILRDLACWPHANANAWLHCVGDRSNVKIVMARRGSFALTGPSALLTSFVIVLRSVVRMPMQTIGGIA